MPDQSRASRREDAPKKMRHNESLAQIQRKQGRVTKARSVMTSTPQHFRQRGFR